MPKGERDSDGSMLLGGAWVVVINDKGGDCCCRLSLMPTSLMIVLDDNNNYVEPTHLMVALAVVTTWCSQIGACRWCPWSLGELLMIPCLWWWCGGALLMWWSPCTWWWLLDSLMMVMVEPCWCGGAHALDDGLGAMIGVDMLCLDDMITWWRWPCLAYLMEMTCIDVMVAWWISAMLRMTWFVDRMAWHTFWRLALACDEVSFTLSSHLPCASPTYSCKPLQDPHTPILNPNTPFLASYSTPSPFL